MSRARHQGPAHTDRGIGSQSPHQVAQPGIKHQRYHEQNIHQIMFIQVDSYQTFREIIINMIERLTGIFSCAMRIKS